MKRIYLALIIVALCGLAPQKVQACLCSGVVAEGPPDEVAIAAIRKVYEERGGAVFIGSVVKVEKVKVRAYGLPVSISMKRVTVRVEKYWFGVQSPEVVIFTGTDYAACGVPYVKGQRYLFRADNIEGRLQTNICSHEKISDAATSWNDKLFGEAKELRKKE